MLFYIIPYYFGFVVTIFGQLKEDMFAYAARSSFYFSPKKLPTPAARFIATLHFARLPKNSHRR